MKSDIITLTRLAELPKIALLQASPLTEAEALKWASDYGASVVYYFPPRGPFGGLAWIVY